MKQDAKTGRFTGPSKTLEERFWPKFRRDADAVCWEWQAARSPLGYGYFWDGHRVVPAHRVAYTLLKGPIPVGMDLDHLCRNPSCVNPQHLEPVPHQVNSARGTTGLPSGAQQLAKTECPKGHPYSPENTYRNPSTGARHCRTCRRQWKPKRA